MSRTGRQISSAKKLGVADAKRGHTANPFGDPERRDAWVEGYDSVVNPKLPRFGGGKKKK